MVNKAVRTALERLWKDRCSIFIREEVTDPVTHLTDSEEKPLLQDQPCKLSFETLTSTNGDVLHGTSMSYEVEDGVLHFFVNFNLTLSRPSEETPMETLDVDVEPKKG